MAGRHPGRQGNGGVAQIVSSTPGAIGYVDLSDAKAADLQFASVKNKAGKFVEPTLEATSAAAENIEVKADLTFFTGWADGDAAYPIAAQTWILVYTKQTDKAKGEAHEGVPQLPPDRGPGLGRATSTSPRCRQPASRRPSRSSTRS